LLFFISLGLLVAAAPMGMLLRRSIFGPDRPVPPQRYTTGTIASLAFLEGPSLAGLTAVMLSPTPWPSLAVPILAMAIQALQFPTGDAMQDA
jgi:hypothetical protein